MYLLGLMVSNISNNGKHTFLCRVKSFECTAGFNIFLGVRQILHCIKKLKHPLPLKMQGID